MSQATLIICETKPVWSVAWRRALRGMTVNVVETRALIHCERALAEHPQSMVGIEVTAASLTKALPALDRLHQQFPSAAFLVFADRELLVAEPFLREAGAFHVLDSRREVPQAVRFLRKHAAAKSNGGSPSLTRRVTKGNA